MASVTVPLTAFVGISAGSSPGGPRLGPYVLLDRLGAGAHAVVHLARHELIGVERAVKLLRGAGAAAPERRELLLREARVAARLRHPNVVTVHDCGIADDGAPYLVLEYVAGRSLAARLRDGLPRPAEALAVARQVAAALDHAHAAGVVHCDVKPANVLLGDDGVARLSDFGIAQAGADAPWSGLGTPAYMAPEQHLGRPCGPAADVYGLAAVLFEMLTGRAPSGAGTAAVDRRLSPRASAVLAAGLSRDPSRRPRTAGRLVAALALATESGRARGPRPANPTVTH